MKAALWMLSLAHIWLTATEAIFQLERPTISPASNTVIPRVSLSNVTYTCTTSASQILWELNGVQIQGISAVNRYRNVSIFIEDGSGATTTSSLVVTQSGRMFLGTDTIPVLCNSYDENTIRIERGDIYHIIQYDAPSAPEDVQLNYQSEQQLVLQWTRPSGTLEEVDITYDIMIFNLTSGDIMMFDTMDTELLIPQSIEGRCLPHSFSVTASNGAGESNSTTIEESIPISPDVSPISNTQKVEEVIFTGGSDVSIVISFDRATNCSQQFPVLYYTISIDGLEGSLNISDDTSSSTPLTRTLTSSDFPTLAPHQQYLITITACTDFTCRSPRQPLTVSTTDVQAASVVFYDTTVTVSLNCSFAEGSSASGCMFVLSLSNQANTENVTVSRNKGLSFNTSCAELSNTRGAYDMNILVYSVAEDGTVSGSPITADNLVESDIDAFPCPIPSSTSTSRERLSGGSITAIVVLCAVAALAVILMVLIILFLFHLKRKLTKTRPKDPRIKLGDIIDEIKLGIETITGRTETDGEEDEESEEMESFPVAAMDCSRSSEKKSVTLKLLDSGEVRSWAGQWMQSRRRRVLLYPRKIVQRKNDNREREERM